MSGNGHQGGVETRVIWSQPPAAHGSGVLNAKRMGEHYVFTVFAYGKPCGRVVLSRSEALELALELIADLVPRARPATS